MIITPYGGVWACLCRGHLGAGPCKRFCCLRWRVAWIFCRSCKWTVNKEFSKKSVTLVPLSKHMSMHYVLYSPTWLVLLTYQLQCGQVYECTRWDLGTRLSITVCSSQTLRRHAGKVSQPAACTIWMCQWALRDRYVMVAYLKAVIGHIPRWTGNRGHMDNKVQFPIEEPT